MWSGLVSCASLVPACSVDDSDLVDGMWPSSVLDGLSDTRSSECDGSCVVLVSSWSSFLIRAGPAGAGSGRTAGSDIDAGSGVGSE